MSYVRPILFTDPAERAGAYRLGGGWTWFSDVEILERGERARIISARELPEEALTRLTMPRAPLAGLSFDRPRLMGVLNATPDSFSDGGRHQGADGITAARAMHEAGADLIDVGGESTRPGAREVPVADEIARITPALDALSGMALSLDTRKAAVAKAGLARGVAMINDVSGLNFDPEMAATVASNNAALCLMHSHGLPATMQQDPRYDDVLLDVYDALSDALTRARAAGIAPARIMLDPGIGFGKTLQHNLTLLRRIALFHSLGCPLLLGVSRKRMIGTLAGVETAQARGPGSMALGLMAAAQGVQMLRVHDVAMTAQGLAMARALWQGETKQG